MKYGVNFCWFFNKNNLFVGFYVELLTGGIEGDQIAIEGRKRSIDLIKERRIDNGNSRLVKKRGTEF